MIKQIPSKEIKKFIKTSQMRKTISMKIFFTISTSLHNLLLENLPIISIFSNLEIYTEIPLSELRNLKKYR